MAHELFCGPLLPGSWLLLIALILLLMVEDCPHRKKKGTLSSDACCVKNKTSVGSYLECYCKKYRGGRQVKIKGLREIKSASLELRGCVEAAMCLMEEHDDIEEVLLVCDNEGVCRILSAGFSTDEEALQQIRKFNIFNNKGVISAIEHRCRELTHGADSTAGFGEEYAKSEVVMNWFLGELRKFALDIAAVEAVSRVVPTVELAAEVLNPSRLMLFVYYRRVRALLKRGSNRFGAVSADKRLTQPDLAVCAVVAAYISSIGSFVGEEVDPRALQSFEQFLQFCISGNGCFTVSDMINWYYPARNLVRIAQQQPKQTAARRRMVLLKCWGELNLLLDSVPVVKYGRKTKRSKLEVVKTEPVKAEVVVEQFEDTDSFFGKVKLFFRNLLSPLAGDQANQRLSGGSHCTKGLAVALSLKSKSSANDSKKNGTHGHAICEDPMAVFKKSGTVKSVDSK